MLAIVGVMLIALWVFGVVASFTLGGFIHLLLVVALATIALHFFRGHRQPAQHHDVPIPLKGDIVMKKTPIVLGVMLAAGLCLACGDRFGNDNDTLGNGRPPSARNDPNRPDDANRPGDQNRPEDSTIAGRDPNQPGAGDQSETQADRKTTRKIRQAVMADGSLSMAAHNVQIVTVGGKVTLRGSVESAAEKSAIAQKANQVAGATNVDNQLEIKP